MYEKTTIKIFFNYNSVLAVCLAVVQHKKNNIRQCPVRAKKNTTDDDRT
jgi:hypothetical protein